MTLHLHPDVSAAYTGTGAVLLDRRNGRYWQLNPTGAEVLRALGASGSADGATADLAERHGLDPEDAARDVAALVAALRDGGLVVSP
jgi:hypothetical protein